MKLSNIKKFNLFVFFTMLAKLCVDSFLPVILYKLNFSINAILIFLLITNILNIIIAIPITKLGKKYGFKYMLVLSFFFFILLYLIVSYMKKSIIWYVVILVFYCFSNMLYYLSRHNYAAISFDNNKTRGVGGIVIATIFATMFSAILSAVLLDKISIKFITIIVSLLYLIGCLFIFSIKIEPHKNKSDLLTVHKSLPLNNKIFYLIEQFKVLFFSLYPLYIYIYIENTYSFIGIVSLITSIASIIFIYFYSRKHNNINSIKIPSILLSLILLADILSVNKKIILVIGFVEGLITKLYDLSITKVMYSMQSDLEGSTYFLYMEILYEVGRIIILIFMLLFQVKLKMILYIAIAFIFISSFIPLKIED